MTRWIPPLVGGVLFLAAGGPLVAQRPDLPEAARFDWFTYEGDDSVYHQVRAGAGEYLNPILAGFYPDPSICRFRDDYYLVTSSFTYYPGIPLFRSRDLVHWTQLGHVLNRPTQLNVDSLGTSRGIFAPSLTCRPDRSYLITTLADRGGNFLVSAATPAGPWSDPVWLPFDGIDPSLFFDDDGKVYIVNNGPPAGEPLYQGHRAIWIQEYDSAARALVGPRPVIVNGGVDLSRHPIWIEAPHLFKKDGWYYLICAEGGTADQHSEVVFRSRGVFGPYEPGPVNPILTQRHLDPARPFPITSTGHAEFVETQNGEWWAVFLGTRPYDDDTYNIGRETFLLPVRWHDGWPLILTGSETVPYAARAPDLPADTLPGTPLSGNFTVRDDFDGRDLGPAWAFIRTVREPWYDLTSTPGCLTIQARPATLEGLGQPSFVGRRQQHLRATASAAMRYRPRVPGDEAGITAFQSSDYYFFLGVTLVEGRPVIELKERAGPLTQGTSVVLASAPLEASPDSTLYLRIRANGGTYDFSYAYRPEEWVRLKGDVDGTILSTRVARGFVGTMLGMYAHHDTTMRGSPAGTPPRD